MRNSSSCRTDEVKSEFVMEENKINRIRSCFKDKKSLIYFDARTRFLNDTSLTSFYKIIRTADVKYTLRDVDSFTSDKKVSGWIIYGCDDSSIYNYWLMKDSGYNVAGCYAENNSIFQSALNDNITFLDQKTAEVLIRENGYILILSIPCKERGKKDSKIGTVKKKLKISSQNIMPIDDHIVGRTGWQYFDQFSYVTEEIFVDGGSLDGRTSFEFIKWCNSCYKKIYAFEPNKLMFPECKRRLEDIPCEKLVLSSCALWHQETNKKFWAEADSKWDAKISDDGNFMVNTIKLDSMVGNDNVTFIKLDVEGAEKEALIGAKQCIKNNKPKLAISVYHNPDDFLKITDYLSNLVPEYKFVLRHYHSDCIETILYAYTEEGYYE